MHILLVADGRSPTTLTYLNTLRQLEYQVSLISTFPCQSPAGMAHFMILPVALGRLAGSQAGRNAAASVSPQTNPSPLRRMLTGLRRAAAPLRYTAGPLSLPFFKSRYLRALKTIQPDAVHALRIPFEGMLASYTPAGIPLIISTWGNDLTLHARGSRLMQTWTRKTLRRADGLVSDTRRDVRLAGEWGFASGKPAMAVPGSGGLDLGAIDQAVLPAVTLPLKLKQAARLVVNPRGFRPGSVRNDTFFAAIPLVLERLPDTLFACFAMQGQPEARGWLDRLKIHDSVELLPYLPQQAAWSIFHMTQVTVSVSQHDGTPNSLLEAMACGCFPIAGDIESLREWIEPGQNGLLVDPSSPRELADALVQALSDESLRGRAATLNRRIVEQRASRGVIQAQLRSFYANLIR